MKKILVAAFVMVLIYSCSHSKKITGSNTAITEKPTPPPPPLPPVINTTIDSIKIVTASIPDGKTTFTAKCGRCHRLYSPSEFDAPMWQPIVTRMALKAHLNDTEKANVLAYVKDGAKK